MLCFLHHQHTLLIWLVMQVIFYCLLVNKGQQQYLVIRGAKEADRLTFKELGARMIGNILGFADGLKAGAKALIDEEYITDPFLKVELARQRAIGGITGKIIRIPTRALAAEDLFFKAINYRQDVMGLATRQAIKEGNKDLMLLGKGKEILITQWMKFQI